MAAHGAQHVTPCGCGPGGTSQDQAVTVVDQHPDQFDTAHLVEVAVEEASGHPRATRGSATPDAPRRRRRPRRAGPREVGWHRGGPRRPRPTSAARASPSDCRRARDRRMAVQVGSGTRPRRPTGPARRTWTSPTNRSASRWRRASTEQATTDGPTRPGRRSAPGRARQALVVVDPPPPTWRRRPRRCAGRRRSRNRRPTRRPGPRPASSCRRRPHPSPPPCGAISGPGPRRGPRPGAGTPGPDARDVEPAVDDQFGPGDEPSGSPARRRTAPERSDGSPQPSRGGCARPRPRCAGVEDRRSLASGKTPAPGRCSGCPAAPSPPGSGSGCAPPPWP